MTPTEIHIVRASLAVAGVSALLAFALSRLLVWHEGRQAKARVARINARLDAEQRLRAIRPVERTQMLSADELRKIWRLD